MQTGINSLDIAPDARSAGMGELGAATDPDANSQYWNPSKYAFAPSRGEVSLSYTPWLRKIIDDIFLANLSGYWKIGSYDMQAISATLNEGGALQQSMGGIETLFKDSADTVKAYAARAYETAGLSANAYMEMVTGFSASLLQGMGGDTAAAAEIADIAMQDMSDNANKMGTDMQSIQNAYQGFAKNNYTINLMSAA